VGTGTGAGAGVGAGRLARMGLTGAGAMRALTLALSAGSSLNKENMLTRAVAVEAIFMMRKKLFVDVEKRKKREQV
jgi:hypothetical protein